MKAPEGTNEDINSNEDETSAQNADINEDAMPANDGFKTGNKSQGLTWEQPMDEQAFDSKDLSENDEDADQIPSSISFTAFSTPFSAASFCDIVSELS